MNTNRTRKPVASKRAQQGFSLIEMAIVIAIAAILLFLVYMRLSKVQDSRIANDEASNFSSMMTDIRTRFGAQGDFAGVTTAVLVGNGLVPSNMVKGAAGAQAIVTGWNTVVTVAPATLQYANDAVALTYQVPRKQCSDFTTAAAQAAARVTVGGTIVKNAAAGLDKVNLVQLGTSCDASAAGNVTVVLEQSR
jgi:prepilin-type N-terminal cleavage/methylation domain-containing protein